MVIRINFFGRPNLDTGNGPIALDGVSASLVLYLACQTKKKASSDDVKDAVYPGLDAAPVKLHANRSKVISFDKLQKVWCFTDRSTKDSGRCLDVETDYDDFLTAYQSANRRGIDDAAKRTFLIQALAISARGVFLGGLEYSWAVNLREDIEIKIKLIKEALSKLSPMTVLHPILPPSPPANFTGRDDDVRDIVRKLTTNPFPGVVLYGGPGFGKTALSLMALWDNETIHRFANRRYWVDASEAIDTATLEAEIATAIDLPERVEWEALYAALRLRAPCILAIDNIETTLQRDPKRCYELLSRLSKDSEIALLCSYRGKLGGAGTFWHHSIPVKPLSEEAAMILFANTAHRPDWRENEQVRATVKEIDCIPLCVILLSYRAINDNSLGNFRKSWKELRLRLLSPDHETVRDRNWEMCLESSLRNHRLQADPDALRMVSIMGQLPNGIADSSLMAMGPEQSVESIRTLEAVGLVDYDAKTERYRMLHPVRDYLQETYPPDFEKPEWKRVEAYYLDLLKQKGPFFGFEISSEARKELLAELNNFCAVLLHASEEADDALWRYGRLIWSAAQGDMTPIIKATESSDVRRRLRFTPLLGAIYTLRNEPSLASLYYTNAIAIAKEQEDNDTLVHAWHGLADMYRSQYNDEEALKHYASALTLYRQMNHNFGQACCLTGQAHIFLGRAELERAWTNYQESYVLYERSGLEGNQTLGQAACQQGFGEISVRWQKFDEAEGYFKAAYHLYGLLPYDQAQGDCLKFRGIIALKREDVVTADAHFHEAARLFEACRAWEELGQCFYFLSVLPNAPDKQQEYEGKAAQIWADFLTPERIVKSQELCRLYLSR